MDLSNLDLTNPEDYERLKTLFSDKNWRIDNLYYIKDKNAKRVKFSRNEDQIRYNQRTHYRNINLKARQKGFTTDACIDSLDDALFTPYFNAGIIADDLDNAKEIFTEKVKFAYDNLPEVIRINITAKTDREGELKFSNGSSISVDTSFRGGTLRRLHVSEFGKIANKFPKKAIEIITGAFESVPIDGRIDVESTAEGMSGAFYSMCQEAIAKKDAGAKLTMLDFKFHFHPWHTSKEYRLDPEGVLIPPKLQKYFDYLKDKHGIDLDAHQKAWYVKKEEQQKALMKREYPSFPEEAFLNSGRPVFDQEKIAGDIARAEKLTFEQGRFDNKGEFVKDDHGPYKIFKRPKNGKAYAIGADVAEGLESGDYSTQFVIGKDFEQMASYHNHVHPDLFGAEMIHLGNFFKKAMLAPEVNNHGLTTLTHINNKNYPHLFMRKVLDERTNEFVSKIGWQTNAKTKPLMLDEFIAAYNGHGDYKECPLVINDVETLREMLGVVYDADGSVNLNGKDRVVAGCVGLQASKQIVEEFKEVLTTERIDKPKTLEELLSIGANKEESFFD